MNTILRPRKYKGFRFNGELFSEFGGACTADCVGCNLRCRGCWSFWGWQGLEKNFEEYTAEQVAEKLLSGVEKHGVGVARICGGEPLLFKEHTLQVAKTFLEQNDYALFVIETNGLFIDEAFVEELKELPRLVFRVSLKAPSREKYEDWTSFDRFDQALQGIELLAKFRASGFWVVVLDVNCADSEELLFLREKLEGWLPGLGDLEMERFIAPSPFGGVILGYGESL